MTGFIGPKIAGTDLNLSPQLCKSVPSGLSHYVLDSVPASSYIGWESLRILSITSMNIRVSMGLDR